MNEHGRGNFGTNEINAFLIRRMTIDRLLRRCLLPSGKACAQPNK